MPAGAYLGERMAQWFPMISAVLGQLCGVSCRHGIILRSPEEMPWVPKADGCEREVGIYDLRYC